MLLAGPLPSSWPEALKLQVLQLSENSLSGPLPPLDGFAPTLESFDISYNAFSGRRERISSDSGWDSLREAGYAACPCTLPQQEPEGCAPLCRPLAALKLDAFLPAEGPAAVLQSAERPAPQ